MVDVAPRRPLGCIVLDVIALVLGLAMCVVAPFVYEEWSFHHKISQRAAAWRALPVHEQRLQEFLLDWYNRQISRDNPDWSTWQVDPVYYEELRNFTFRVVTYRSAPCVVATSEHGVYLWCDDRKLFKLATPASPENIDEAVKHARQVWPPPRS